MIQVLLQPFPLFKQAALRLRTALGFGLFVFLFLFVFQPFGLGEMGRVSLAWATFFYGLVCFSVLLGWFFLLPLLLPRVFCEAGWTVWKEIVASLVCTLAVCVGNILFTHFYFHVPLGLSLVLRFLWMTFSVSIIPIVVMVLTRQMRLMRTYSQQALELDRQLVRVSAGTEVPKREGTEPDGPELLYAEAADNYVKVFYSGEQKLVRSSLKQLEEELRGNERIFRCHRAYLVNLDKVVHISGNAQGYKLHLEGSEQVIPVSRTLNGQIAKLVARPKDPSVRPSGL